MTRAIPFKRLHAQGRIPLRVGNVSRELKELPKTRGLKELFRNTQHYEPQISRYLESRFYDSYEAFKNNPCPALHLESDGSGSRILTLGKISKSGRGILEYTATLEQEFLVSKGIDEDAIFKAEERALERDMQWISDCIVKSKRRKNEKSNTF